MITSKTFKNTSFLLTFIVVILLVAAVLFLMNFVQYLLESDTKINLAEIATQNKDVITSKLMLEVNSLDLISKQLSERFSQANSDDPHQLKSIFIHFLREKDDDSLFWASKDGIATFSDGSEINISGRNYFRLADQGIQNISEKMVSRQTGEDIFVISVPLIDKGKVIGAIQKHYTPQDMYNLCSISLFSEQGHMYIINSQGYIQISSQQNLYNREADNYFRLLFLDNTEASKQLETDIQNNKEGFMEIELNGETYFSAYTPINQIYDWYLISSVSTNAVSPNANIVIKLFYYILLVVVLIFALSMFYFLRLKNKQQSNIERVAFVDIVTSGNTYTKFIYSLQPIMQTNRSEHFYIFTFDIVNFKYINSTSGFDVGDQVLRSIYQIHAKKLNSNELIARIHSDHFVLLLQDVSEQRLETLFNSELIINGITVYLSAGLYPISDRDESVNLMVDKANMAAQRIKGARYKRIGVYSEDFDQQLIHNEQLKRSIEQALANDEIIPFFQPKVDIHNRELVGAEALARWQTRDGKMIPPSEFIPICEQTGLITSIDLTIFDKTLQFIRHQLDMGVSCVPISVNFSRIHLLNKQFLQTLLSKMQDYEVPSHLVELELTESVMFDNYQIIEEFINQLHDNGFQVSMDDFGSGYSSLHMLKSISIDVLKIDRCFMQESANSDKQKAVFSAITQMAEKLKIKVVVEGVETIENVEMMKEFGCSIAQGYYFAKPMNQHEFEKVYMEGKVC